MILAHMSVLLTAVSFGLYAAMMTLFARAMSKRRAEAPARNDRAPRVTIFKPLAGIDDDLEDNLASFARIDYPSFEILLGVAGASDPALVAAKRFVQAHPRLDARIVVTDRDAAINPKVAQLIGLEREATGEVYVISDSNVRVGDRYLGSLAAEFADERVGMVTNVFVGTGERTLGAALENLQISASSAPGYAAMNTVSRRPLTVGKSMAMRRRDLVRLGGFSPVGNVLAEDHVLGRRFLDAGFVVRTCMDPVENRNVACSVARTIERHTRWAKMRRSLLPAGFAVEPLMTPIVVATLGLVLAPCEATAAALAAAWLLQTVASFTAVRLARGRWMAFKYAPLEVVRSYLTFLCWVRACGSRRIEWRGHPFALLPGSVIVPVVPQTDRSARSSLAV
ncbi:MAG TPA: glycosyltransferase [Polyangiaceae bacterium]|nr:glycosyltransferase [Polyangiaceae bacterium]